MFEMDKEEYEIIEKKQKCFGFDKEIENIDLKIKEIENEKEKLLRNMGGYNQYLMYKDKDYPEQYYGHDNYGHVTYSGGISHQRGKITLANHIKEHIAEIEMLNKDKENINNKKKDLFC